MGFWVFLGGFFLVGFLLPILPMVHVPAVALAVLLRVDAGQDVGEKGGGPHRDLYPLEREELRLLEDVVDPLQLGKLDVVLEGERMQGVTAEAQFLSSIQPNPSIKL